MRRREITKWEDVEENAAKEDQARKEDKAGKAHAYACGRPHAQESAAEPFPEELEKD